MIWRKVRKLVSIVLFLALVGGVYFLVAERMMVEIKDKRNRAQESAAIRDYQRKRLGELPKMRDDFALAEASEEKIASFIDKDHAVDFIQEVEKLSEKTNGRVEIEVVPAGSSTKNKNSKKEGESIMTALPSKEYLQFNIKTAGTFLGLVRFINQLENSQYYLDVISVQVDANPDAGNEREEAKKENLNPFASRAGENGPSGDDAADREEVIALIGVVVYTQSQ